MGAWGNRSWRIPVLALAIVFFSLLPCAISTAAEPLSAPISFASNQAALDYYLELAEKLDVATAVDKTVFYSGQVNRKMAEEFAVAEDKTTLEMTPGGKYLDDLRLFEPGSPLTPDQAKRVWSRLSRRYATQAAGNVFCFVAAARPTGVFTTIELPELRNNRKILAIYSVSRL